MSDQTYTRQTGELLDDRTDLALMSPRARPAPPHTARTARRVSRAASALTAAVASHARRWSGLEHALVLP